MRMMMTCLHSASRSGSVTPKCEKWLMLMWPFFLVVFGVGFALDVYFFIFFDTSDTKRGNILINRQLSGVRLRCQIGVIWFWLTPIDRECSRIGNFLTPLILNKLSGFSVRWCQMMFLQFDTEERIDIQLHTFCGVRSVRLFR